MNKRHQIKKMPLPEKFEDEFHQRIYLALKETVDAGIRPLKIPILRLAGINSGYLRESNKPWIQKMLQLIEAKELEWQHHGGIEYINLDKIIHRKILKGERPGELDILDEAGFSRHYFRDKNNFYPFRKKLFTRIKLECTLFDNAKTYERQKKQEQIKQEALKAIPNGMELLCITGYTSKELHTTFLEKEATEENCKSVGLLLETKESAIPLSQVMYAERERADSSHRSYYIKPDSFDISRRQLFNGLIQMTNKYKNSPNSLTTIFKDTLDYLDFCDKIESHPVPINIESAREGYKSYIQHLRERIKFNQIAAVSANQFQNTVINYIKFLFPSHQDWVYIFKKIKKIQYNSPTNSTEVEHNQIQYAITYYAQFFLQAYKLLFEKEITFPRVITIQEKRYLCMPFGSSPLHQEGNSNVFFYYNIETASFRSLNEIAPISNNGNKKDRDFRISKSVLLKKYQLALDAVNTNPIHLFRLLLAERAFQAFYMLLSAITGMKDSELANLKWGDNDEIDVERTAIKGIVTIKPRAYHKEMHYEIHRSGVILLRKAAKLRRYLLQGHLCDYFFFIGHGTNISTTGTLKIGSHGSLVNARHQNINPDLPRIGTRKLRVFKSKLIMKQSNGNAWLASMMLGHSLAINTNHYQSKAKKEREAEIHRFAESMIQAITIHKNRKHQTICESYNEPEFAFNNKAFTCDNIFACFICKKHVLFPDEEDIHKLLSLRYILKRINTARTFNQVHFDDVLLPIDNMALLLLKLMATKHGCGALINTVQEKVYQKANLHPYWDFKIRYLYELGVL